MNYISLIDIIITIYKRLKIFLMFLCVPVFFSLVYILITKPIYNPSAIVKANIYETVPTWIADLLQQRLVPSTPVDRMASQVELIKVLSKNVLKENGVNIDFELNKSYFKIVEKKTIIDTIRNNLNFKIIFYPESILVFKKNKILCSGKFEDTINCNYFSFVIKKLKNFNKPFEGKVVYKNPLLTIDDWIKNRINVDQIGISDLIKISVEDYDPEYAVKVANNIAKEYVNYSLEEERRLARETRKRLEVFYEEAQRRVDSLKKIIKALKVDTLSLVTYILDFGLGNEPMARIVERYFNNPGDEILKKVSREYVNKSLTLEEIFSAYNMLVGQRNALMSAIENTKLVEAKSVSVAQILDYAVIPPKPKWPKKFLLLILSFVFGIIFSTIFTLIFDRMDRNVFTPTKLKSILNENAKVFYNYSSLKFYLISNGFSKIYSNEKIDNFENVNLEEAELVLIVLRKPIIEDEFINFIKLSKNKEKVVFIPV